MPGSSFVDILELFEGDSDTELVVLSGEIGGSAEEEAADYIAEHMTQAGGRLHRGLHGARRASRWATPERWSPAPREPRRRRRRRSKRKGVRVGRTPTETAAIAVEVLGGAPVSAA